MVGAIRLLRGKVIAHFPPDAPRTPDDPLAEIYARFTAGFDTADLQEAKALLEELASRSLRLHLDLEQLPPRFVHPTVTLRARGRTVPRLILAPA